MKKIIYEALIFLALLITGMPESGAQNLPSLPDDPAITRGNLPNDIAYYLVSNPTRKGMADMSVVWKSGLPVAADSLVEEKPVSVDTLASIAAECLAGTEIFSADSPESFLRRHGIRSGRDGFIEVRDDAVVFNFRNVNLARGESVMDSLLLLAFDMSKSYSSIINKKSLKDCGQAVIISGDINKPALQEKLKMLSMFVPEIAGNGRQDTYLWSPGDSTGFFVVRDSSSHIATVFATYLAPRIPYEYMNTVLPLVSSRMGKELGQIIRKRLYKDFATLGIPVAEVGYEYTGSSDWGGDEKYGVFVKTSPENVGNVVQVISSALSAISYRGISTLEYAEVRKVIGRKSLREAGSVIKDNEMYTDRCISSFLHGASLSSKAEMGDFFGATAMSDYEGNKFFNKFSSSLLDKTNNLTVGYVSDTCQLDSAEVKKLFTGSWNNRFSTVVSNPVNFDDTVGFAVSVERCKIKKEKSEPLSGGKLWVFANGMKAVYKKVPSGGRFWYSMIIRGGTASVFDIKAGQGAYYGDMMSLFNVRGMRPDDFGYLLSARDIDLKYRAGVSDIGIYGSAPSDAIDFLLKALVGITETEEIDSKAFSYYLECEKLRLADASGSRYARYAAIDSLMCPGYRYSVFKSESGLSESLKEDAEKFFRNQFSKVNDGVFVIVGDIDEYELKKKLQEYFGAFSVTDRVMPRPGQAFQTISGESTYIVDGKSKSLDVAMSAPVQLTTANYMAAKIASMAVEDELEARMSDVSAVLTVSDFFSVLPRDRFNLMLTLEDGSPEGFSCKTSAFVPVNMLFSLRSAVEKLAYENVSDEKLSMYKATLKNRIASYEQDPRYWVDMITRRFSDGKDLHSGYASQIDAVTADQVRDMIALLNSSGKVEYVVRP